MQIDILDDKENLMKIENAGVSYPMGKLPWSFTNNGLDNFQNSYLKVMSDKLKATHIKQNIALFVLLFFQYAKQ